MKANNIVLVVTTFVAYFTSPSDSFARIGITAKAGAADCTMKVLLSRTGNVPNILLPRKISPIITKGESTNLPKRAKTVSLSKLILFSPAFESTIPI